MAVTAPPAPPSMGSKDLPRLARSRSELKGIFNPGLPFYVIPALPFFWALGLSYFTFAIAGAATGIGLLMMKPIRIPNVLIPWLLYVGWMLASVFTLEPTVNRYLSFLFRAVTYIGATNLFLYVYNVPQKYLPTGRILASIASIFVFTAIVGGYLGLILGEVRLQTPLSFVMPRSLLENPLVNNLVRPPFAQTHDFLGFALNRPAMPFPFTNMWGAALVPTTFAAVAAAGRAKRFRAVLPIVALAALIPMVISANRGLWIALVGSVIYVAIRRASTGQLVLAIRLVIILFFAGALILASPLGEVAAGRTTSSHSFDARGDIYSDVLERVPGSPLLGYGAPISNPDPNRPAIGTHGMFWTALFSQGIPGVILYVTFWVGMAIRTGRRIQNQEQLLLHLAVASAIPTMFVYDHLPAPLAVMMICAAVFLRDQRVNDEETARAMSQTAVPA